jgi:hypothetical protein
MKVHLGKEVKNGFEDPNFMITIIQNFDEVKTWHVNPALETVMSDGHIYKFDIGLLNGLAKNTH